MASVAEKLYPPTIGSSMPAFYVENGTATIAVPFSMNRAVSGSNIIGFRLKIKTVQSNTIIKILDNYEVSNSLTNRTVKFLWQNLSTDEGFQKIRLGQYLKVQMAYISNNSEQTIGYFSTVGIIKYTSKPNVYLKRSHEDLSTIEAFRQTYTGVYETTEDKSERPYSYCFYLYNYERGLVETSGWRLHNTTLNNVASESLSLTETTDTYTFQTLLNTEELYYIQYSVKTINNLEVSSPMYSCMEPDMPYSYFGVDLIPENNFEEAYIELKLQLKDKYTLATDEELQTLYPNVIEIVSEDAVDYVNGISITYKKFKIEEPDVYLTDEYGNEVYYIYARLTKPISIEICRASKMDNYNSWQILKRKYFETYEQALSWSYKDFSIEQGITYKYCFRQYSENGVQSGRTESKTVVADFEDMFLWDGTKQLKIRFNPKVSSFKTTRFEQKIDTLGSKYPFIFRNGVVSYKEFPISGLISYLADNHEWFAKAKELDLVTDEEGIRFSTPVNQNENDLFLEKSWENSRTLDSIGYNMRAERLFKLKLLEWLGNGEIKMFKSPQEGNYLVRLLNISLTPDDRLGRMLHTFSCTAYEVEEINYNNLLSLGFLNVEDEERSGFLLKSIFFRDQISKITNKNESIKINEDNIYNYFKIEYSVNTAAEGLGFYVRIGTDSGEDNKALITPKGLIFNSGFAFDSRLPDVYFNIMDNIDLLRELSNNSLNQNNVESLKSLCRVLVGDTILTYWYNTSEILIGDFNNIEEIYIKNEISSYIGPVGPTESISFPYDETQQILKFFVLDFQEKSMQKIIYKTSSSGDYYLTPPLDGSSSDTSQRVSHFDDTSLYLIYVNTITNTSLKELAYSKNGELFSIITNLQYTDGRNILYYSQEKYYSDVTLQNEVTTFSTSVSGYKIFDVENNLIDIAVSSTDRHSLNSVIDTSIWIQTVDNQIFNFDKPPKVNLDNNFISEVKIGNKIWFNCAYQIKVTERKEQ